jgi:transcriptional regulator with XRE-family HTH domain
MPSREPATSDEDSRPQASKIELSLLAAALKVTRSRGEIQLSPRLAAAFVLNGGAALRDGSVRAELLYRVSPEQPAPKDRVARMEARTYTVLVLSRAGFPASQIAEWVQEPVKRINDRLRFATLWLEHPARAALDKPLSPAQDESIEKHSLGRELREARSKAGLTLEELAQQTGMSKSALSQAERSILVPRPAAMKRLATEFANDQDHHQRLMRKRDSAEIVSRIGLDEAIADLAVVLNSADESGELADALSRLGDERIQRLATALELLDPSS